MSAFKGFRDMRLQGAGAAIFARVGGEGPPLLLLHGFPQTHFAWRHVAARLAKDFTLVCADLRGYGASGAPPDDAAHTAYSKRVMAADMIAAMDQLGFRRFHVAGHDRGGRVAYRMALDAPEAVDRLAVLEIAPTAHYWRAFGPDMAMKAWHWTFLAQPAPLPERLISANPGFFIDSLHAAWARDGNLRPFEDGAFAAYHAALTAPGRIAAYCADYRAGATTDRAMDEADLAAGRRIAAPTLVIAGTRGFPAVATGGDPAKPWRDFCDDLRAVTVDCGHFPAEEAPDATAAALRDFFRGA
ncbi:MAG: alpha/beta fold hydrolase [Rubrimonas sp.]